MNGQPKEAIAEAICDTMDNPDVQAAKLYFVRSNRVRERRTTQRRLDEAVNVTPTAAAFLPRARQSNEPEPTQSACASISGH
jgi:hypothetical protein